MVITKYLDTHKVILWEVDSSIWSEFTRKNKGYYDNGWWVLSNGKSVIKKYTGQLVRGLKYKSLGRPTLVLIKNDINTYPLDLQYVIDSTKGIIIKY